MKTYIDLEETYKGSFLASRRFKNRLIRYWGTETVDGVEVFKKKFIVWPNTERKDAKKILKMFGMWNQVYGQSFSGLTSYYLWFNPKKVRHLDDIADGVFVNQINRYLTVGEAFTVNINVTDASNPDRFSSWTKQNILDYVDANYETLIDQNFVETSADAMSQEAIAQYVLLDDGSDFQVEVVNAQVTPIAKKRVDSITYAGSVYYISGISLELRVTQLRDLTESSPMITGIRAESDQLAVRKLQLLANSADDSAQFDWTSDGGSTIDDVWYKGQLRVAATDSYYLKRNDFMKVIGESLDTGYTRKKTKWWKKLLAMVIVVLVVWFTWGWGATLSGAASGTLTAVAANLGIATLVLTVVQVTLAKSLGAGFAMYFGRLVQVVSTVSSVLGIASMVQNLAANAAKAATSVKGFFNNVGNMSVSVANGTVSLQTVVNSTAVVGEATIGAIGTEIVQQTTIDTLASFSFGEIKSMAFKTITKLIDMKMDSKLIDAKNNAALTTEAAAQAQDELNQLSDRQLDISAKYMAYSSDELRSDSIAYQVDYLYEGTPSNIGRPSFMPTGLNLRDAEYRAERQA